ncbi:LOW QUALITY PROTEIN: XPG_N domain-containing protein/XPG_I domain-containing protein, partial [Cephalotus follicularis]
HTIKRAKKGGKTDPAFHYYWIFEIKTLVVFSLWKVLQRLSPWHIHRVNMGVKNLWDILESCKRTLPLHHLQNKRLCIDLSCWMVQLQNVNKSHSAKKEKFYLSALFHRLRALIALNCSLIFVTDGSIPAIKLATYRRRLNSGSKVTPDEADLQRVYSLQRNMGSEFSCMIKEAKGLGLALGVPCLDGIEEAEAQCALLNAESLCDGCFTSDSDVFLFGARTVYRDICLGEGGHVICYEMADIERNLGFGRNSLESACQIVKEVGDSTVLQRIASEGLTFAKKTKTSKKQGQILKCSNKENTLDHEAKLNGSNYNSQKENRFSQVIDAYLKPKCHSADSDAVHRVLAQHPFQRARLQQTCAQFFHWPPEKTDEYFFSKIAEKDLFLFANLRSTFFELVDKCPVSGIVFLRKIQGRDFFEVSWEEFFFFETSVVPVFFIESACPERIFFFEDKRARFFQNHRKTIFLKSESRSFFFEIDEKLQFFLLEIESG